MSRKKKKNLHKQGLLLTSQRETSSQPPISELPTQLLRMQVKSGTKIRNVMQYAIQEFPKFNSVLWTGIGEGIPKTISCVEIFKRHHSGLHQRTKLSYHEKENDKIIDCKDEAKEKAFSKIPQIYIFLSKEPTSTGESGYQGPNDSGEYFVTKSKESIEFKRAKRNLNRDDEEQSNEMSQSKAAKEFAAMGLRTGQKRPRNEQRNETASKKSKK